MYRIVTPCIIIVLLAALPAAAQNLKLEPAFQGPNQPTGIHHAGDGSDRLFVLSKAGTISIFDGVSLLPTPFLDLSAWVNSNGSERGLHGLAFHPDYTSNGLFYVQFTNLDSDSITARFRVSADPNVADLSSGELVLFIDQPNQWHNVSQLQFGPDGHLYIGAGDGGFVGDPDNRAQNLGSLFGKILRLDVDSALPYAIPPDNPFVGVAGARPEIWAYGVRNPWRFSFDRLTGDLFMGDVGQSEWEEINFQPAGSPGGENYGWRLKEGNSCYDPPSNCDPGGLTPPILEYPHGFFPVGDCAVIGGFVYRGSRFPRFQGTYFYADWCTGKIWAASEQGGVLVNGLILDSNLSPNTFGEDEAGELYIADDSGGMIYRLVDPLPFCDAAMSRESYGDGDTITVSAARLVNLGDQTVNPHLQVTLFRPAGAPVPVLDVGNDGSFQVPPGTDVDRGPVDVLTVNPSTPRGTYELVCQLSVPGGGPVLFEDRATFEID